MPWHEQFPRQVYCIRIVESREQKKTSAVDRTDILDFNIV